MALDVTSRDELAELLGFRLEQVGEDAWNVIDVAGGYVVRAGWPREGVEAFLRGRRYLRARLEGVS